MIDFLRAPLPYIMGLVWDEPTLDRLRLDDDDVVVVNLDRNMVTVGATASIAMLPGEIRHSFIENLYEVSNQAAD